MENELENKKDALDSIAPYFAHVSSGPFGDLPVKVPGSDYDAAIELLVSHWTSLRHRPLSIYQIGQVSTPGISDLDFIIVFQDRIRQLDWIEYQPQTFPEWVQQLFTHPPYCCTETAWTHLRGWYPIFNIRHLWGEVLSTPTISPTAVSGCALGLLVDYLTMKVPIDFLWLAWKSPVCIRLLLASLSSLKYTLKLAEEAGFEISTDCQKTIYDIDVLRSLWFELEPPKQVTRLAQLCTKACKVAGFLIGEVDRSISNAVDSAGVYPEATIESGGSLFEFSNSWSLAKACKIAFESYLQSGRISWILPKRFLLPLMTYADECAEFEKYFRHHGCNFRVYWDGGLWEEGLRYHARAMVKYYRSAERLGVPPQKYIALGCTHWGSYQKLRWARWCLTCLTQFQTVFASIIEQIGFSKSK